MDMEESIKRIVADAVGASTGTIAVVASSEQNCMFGSTVKGTSPASLGAMFGKMQAVILNAAQTTIKKIREAEGDDAAAMFIAGMLAGLATSPTSQREAVFDGSRPTPQQSDQQHTAEASEPRERSA